MNRFIIPENQVVVALDTGVLRSLCYENPGWVDTFAAMANNGYHFCLSEVLMVELIKQFEGGSITSSQWQDCVRKASRFLSKVLPVLPGKKQLFYLSGIRCKNAVDDFDPDFEGSYSRATWAYLLAANGSTFFKNHYVVFSCNGKKYKCQLQLGEADKALEDERKYWIDFVKGFDVLPKDSMAKHKENVLGNMKTEMDSWSIGRPPLSIRTDLLAKYLHEIATNRTKSKEPYNPEAKKKKNDGIDFLLNFAFILPALLCTGDEKFADRLKAISSYQNSWVYTPGELATAWSNGSITTPTWPKKLIYGKQKLSHWVLRRRANCFCSP